MKTMQPPKGWSIELQGLTESVLFRNDRFELLWSDGRWYRQVGTIAVPAPGVGQARTMAEARRAGCEFLHRFESESD